MTDKTVFQCYLCKLITEDQSKINVHMKLAHNIKVDEDSQILEKFVCPQCKFKTGNMADLKKHMMTVHEGIQYSCDKCDHVTTRPEHLKKHKRTKHKRTKHLVFACDLCDYKTAKKFSLDKHNRLHQQILLECEKM